MKKYILSILFFFFLFLKPITVNASYLPPVLPTNTNPVVDFIVSSAMTDLAQNGVKVADKNAFDTINNILNGHSILSSVQSSYIDLGSANFEISTNLYDSNGNQLNQADCYIALISTDAGNATAIYDKSTGEPVLMGDTFASSESSIIAGQLFSNQTSHFPLTQPILMNRVENNGVFVSPTIDDATKELYQSYAFSGYARSTSQGFIIFIPNGCSKNTRILPVQNQYTMNASFTGNINNINYYYTFDFVTNDPSEIMWVNPNNSPYAYTMRSTRYYGGKSFNYTEGWYNTFNVFGFGGEVYFRAPTDSEYNNMMNNDVVYTDPCTDNSNVTNEYYSYTIYNNTYPTYSYTINNNYDPTEPITPENYPRNSNVNIPDYSPTYNYYNDYINYQNTPGTGQDIGQIDPEEATNNLPILTNLEKRFPFSIPFDVYNLLSGMSAERTTPYINTDIVIPGINYTWHFEYDLHAFDDLASLFRTLFLIFFIIGLAWLSYDHFFGS